MATNLFTTAKAAPTKTASGKKAKTFIAVEGIELYAAIDHSIKWLTTLLDTAKAPVAEFATAKWVTEGLALKAKPDNFDCEEGDGNGNIQLKKRGTNSGLDDIEIALCEANEIPLGKVGGDFMINPVRAEWVRANAAKISAALAKVPGCPTDLFVTTPEKIVATDESIATAFRALGKNALSEVLPVLTTIAVKPKFAAADGEADKAMAIINAFINGEDE